MRAFEQRERLEQDRAVVEVVVKFAEYQQVYTSYETAREDKVRVKNEVAQLEEVNRPFTASVEALAGLVKACRKEQDKVDKKVNNLVKDAEQFKSKLDKLVRRLFSLSLRRPSLQETSRDGVADVDPALLFLRLASSRRTTTATRCRTPSTTSSAPRATAASASTRSTARSPSTRTPSPMSLPRPTRPTSTVRSCVSFSSSFLKYSLTASRRAERELTSARPSPARSAT